MCSFAFCFPSRRPTLHSGLQKCTFQVVSFRIERSICLSRLAKVSKLISLCNLYSRKKNYAGVFLTRVFLLKQPDKSCVKTSFERSICPNGRRKQFALLKIKSVNSPLFSVHSGSARNLFAVDCFLEAKIKIDIIPDHLRCLEQLSVLTIFILVTT